MTMGQWQTVTLKDGTSAPRYKGDDGRWYKTDEAGNTAPPSEMPTSQKSMTFTERAKISFAGDDPEAKARAVRGLGNGYDATIKDGKVYAVKDGAMFPVDSDELELADIADWAGEVPEIVGQAAGGAAGFASPIPGGAYIGQGAGSALGRKTRQELAQWLGVEDADREGQLGEIVQSGIIGAAVPKFLDKAMPSIKAGVSYAAGKLPKIPSLGVTSKIVDAGIEKVYGVKPEAFKQVLGPEGKAIAARAAKGDTMLASAAKLAEAPQKVVDDAGKQYAALRDQVISKDTWADADPIISKFNEGLKRITEKGPDGKTRIVGVLKSDLDLFQRTRDLIQRMATNARAGTTKGYGGMSAKYLYNLRLQADGLLKSRKVYTKIERGEDIGPVDAMLLDVRNAMEDEVENTAERYYGSGAGGQQARDAYLAAKEQYRMALEFANQLGQSFGVRSKRIGDKVIFNVADAGRVAQTLRNITNTPKEAQRMLLQDLKRLSPEFAPEVDDVFRFADAKPWMQSEVSTTGKTLRPYVGGLIGGQLLAPALGPAAYPLGIMAGITADAATAPQAAIKYLPAIGEAGRNIAEKVGRIGTQAAATARKAAPAIPAINTAAARRTLEAAPARTLMTQDQQPSQVQRQQPETIKAAEITADPREILGGQWGMVESTMAKAHAGKIQPMINAGMAPEQAAAAIIRDQAEKYRGKPNKLTGQFADVVQWTRKAVRDTYGREITKAEAIELLTRVQ